jgi:hypothetical protein
MDYVGPNDAFPQKTPGNAINDVRYCNCYKKNFLYRRLLDSIIYTAHMQQHASMSSKKSYLEAEIRKIFQQLCSPEIRVKNKGADV